MRMLRSLTLAVVCLVSTAAFADCSALINDAISWASKPAGRYSYHVGFTLSTMKAPTKFVHYSSGSFSAQGGVLKASNVPATFSDRTWCPELPAGSLCVGYQMFDHRKSDKMSFTLNSSGNLNVVLNTWGNATYNVTMQCSQGFLYGVLTEPNGNSFLTMNLNKYSMEIPR